MWEEGELRKLEFELLSLSLASFLNLARSSRRSLSRLICFAAEYTASLYHFNTIITRFLLARRRSRCLYAPGRYRPVPQQFRASHRLLWGVERNSEVHKRSSRVCLEVESG